MKPGDTVRPRQGGVAGFVNFCTLYAQPGPAFGAETKVYEMFEHEVGLVLAVADIDYDGCFITECLVLVAPPGGGTKMGWRETTQFTVVD